MPNSKGKASVSRVSNSRAIRTGANQESKARLEQQVKSMRGQLRNRATAVDATEGTMCIKGTEYWFATQNIDGEKPVNAVFIPGASGISRIDSFASMFDLWRVRKVKLMYRPSVGTTVDGIYHLGIDYEPLNLPGSIGGVVALQPQISHPVWKEGFLVASPERINKAKWMYTASGKASSFQQGFAACCATSTSPGKFTGEVWIEYILEFSGPTSAIQNNVEFHSIGWTQAGTWNGTKFTGYVPQQIGFGVHGTPTPNDFRDSSGDHVDPPSSQMNVKASTTAGQWVDVNMLLQGYPDTTYAMQLGVIDSLHDPLIDPPQKEAFESARGVSGFQVGKVVQGTGGGLGMTCLVTTGTDGVWTASLVLNRATLKSATNVVVSMALATVGRAALQLYHRYALSNGASAVDRITSGVGRLTHVDPPPKVGM